MPSSPARLAWNDCGTLTLSLALALALVFSLELELDLTPPISKNPQNGTSQDLEIRLRQAPKMSQRLVNIVCIIITLAAAIWLYLTAKEISLSKRGQPGNPTFVAHISDPEERSAC